MKRILLYAGRLACVLLLISLAGCSDVFRPIAIPIFNPSGDPQILQRAVVINNNGGATGSVMILDAVADVALAVLPTGKNPVHAASISNNTWIANKDDSTLTVVNTFASGGTFGTTVTLPAGSQPQFVLATDATNIYVANANGTVSSVSPALLVVKTTVAVGANPIAMAETPDLKKIYCVNQGSNNVSVLNADLSSGTVPTIAVQSSPMAAVLNADGSLLFVLNQGSGTVSVIDTASDTLIANLSVGTSPSAMIFDSSLRRLYVANTADNTITIFKADAGTPTVLAAAVPVGTSPVSITALANGTRVYVANRGSNNVSVISTTSNTVTKTITVGSIPISISSGGSSLRVLVTNQSSNNITDIQTSNDTVIATLAAASPNPSFVLSLQ